MPFATVPWHPINISPKNSEVAIERCIMNMDTGINELGFNYVQYFQITPKNNPDYVLSHLTT